jgi:phage baseplate assembly protein V
MSTGRGNFDRHGRPQSPQADITELRNRMDQVVQYGTVEEVDHEKSLARIRFSPTRVSNWIPWATGNADSGKNNSNPLQEKAQVAVFAPSGDAARGFIMPGVYRESTSRFDSSGDVYGDKYEDGTMITFNKATKVYEIAIPSGTANIKVGGVTITVVDNKVTITSADVEINGNVKINGNFETGGAVFTNNGKDVGSNHAHSGILPGPAPTGPPV